MCHGLKRAHSCDKQLGSLFTCPVYSRSTRFLALISFFIPRQGKKGSESPLYIYLYIYLFLFFFLPGRVCGIHERVGCWNGGRTCAALCFEKDDVTVVLDVTQYLARRSCCYCSRSAPRPSLSLSSVCKHQSRTHNTQRTDTFFPYRSCGHVLQAACREMARELEMRVVAGPADARV